MVTFTLREVLQIACINATTPRMNAAYRGQVYFKAFARRFGRELDAADCSMNATASVPLVTLMARVADVLGDAA